MPLYEYRCSSCGYTFERLESFSASPVKVCPECGGEANRLLGVPALQFKGSGFYITDYVRKGNDASGSKSAAKGEGGKLGKEKVGAGKKAAGG